jgi:hypothetical protein
VNYKVLAVLSAVALMVGVGIGHYTLPAKVVTKTEVVKDTSVHKDDHSIVVVTKTQHPDGTVTTVTETKKDVTTDVDKHVDKRKDTEVTYDAPKWTISALMLDAPLSGSSSAPAYGLSVSYRILGPITVTALGASNGLVGAGLGITF